MVSTRKSMIRTESIGQEMKCALLYYKYESYGKVIKLEHWFELSTYSMKIIEDNRLNFRLLAYRGNGSL